MLPNPVPQASLETLKKRSQFLAIAATKRRWVAPGFILQIGNEEPSSEAAPLCVHCGFTTTTKIGNAVVRNRARRRLRALAREVLAPHAKTGHAYVLIGRTTTGTAPYSQLRDDMIKGMQRMKIWRD